MNITGACYCENIQFTAEIDPSRVVICHCTDCQTFSGSAFRVNVAASCDSFKLTKGTPKTFLKIAESGAERLHGFCDRCGTPLYSVAPHIATLIFLRLGAIHQRDSLRPSLQIWRRSTPNWLHELASLPGSSEQQALVAK
jgi:hypothetical protein